MNIHHLELFYYVARFGGVTEAARHMPYGIQQPAISVQILQLEDELGKKLFQRRPFALSQEGQDLFAFIRPFFEGLDGMASKLRGGTSRQLRVGAAEIIFRDHLPAVVARVKARFPQLRLRLRSGYQAQMEEWLTQQQIDVAITAHTGEPPAGLGVLALLELKLGLLVPRRCRVQNAKELLARDPIDEPLVCLPSSESITRQFQEGLKSRGLEWPPGIEASSLMLVGDYVAAGYGVGLTFIMAGQGVRRGLRLLPLDGFKPVRLSALWLGEPSPLVRSFLDELRDYAGLLAKAAP